MKTPTLPMGRELISTSGELETAVVPETTGRYILTFQDGEAEEARKVLERAGFVVASADDAASGVLREQDAAGTDVLIFPRVDMALLSGEDDHYERIRALNPDNDPNNPIVAINPETVVYAAGKQTQNKFVSDELTTYLRGYSDAVQGLTERLLREGPVPARTSATMRDMDSVFGEDEATWGLQITRVVDSQFTGRGIRLAVLDSGIDVDHRDFRGRIDPQNTISFVPSDVRDRLGHGTHCAGIACGPANPAEGPRYGVAPNVEIHIAKVVNDAGVGSEARIIAAIDWAIMKRCHIISVSIEDDVSPGATFRPDYENAGRRALQNSALVIAAAGNHSDRRVRPPRPVAAPANCPSIMAVGSVGQTRRVSHFSNGGVNPNGGEVNFAAPGESIHSSFRGNSYLRDSGTSQATPLVAGIAALFAEADPNARGQRLGTLLQQFALNIGAHPVDAGAGLVQAPT